MPGKKKSRLKVPQEARARARDTGKAGLVAARRAVSLASAGRCCILDHTFHKRFSRRVALFLSAYHFLGTTRSLQYHRSTQAPFSVTFWVLTSGFRLCFDLPFESARLAFP